MSRRTTLEKSAPPATLEAILQSVVQLSRLDESELQELVSQGRLADVFPFRPRTSEVLPDFVDEGDIVEASPLPLSRQERRKLIQSSMPNPTRASSSEFDDFAALVGEDTHFQVRDT